jgi:N-acetyl-anhydromuramyl-L-alanine amidase AmpD
VLSDYLKRIKSLEPKYRYAVYGASTVAAGAFVYWLFSALGQARKVSLPMIPELSPGDPNFLQAKSYKPANRQRVDLVVLHSTENPVKPGIARNIASWFAGDNAPQASAHYVVGPDDIYQGVLEKDISWAAPGVNDIAVNVEQVGQALSTDWTSAGSGPNDGLAVLRNSAELVRSICDRWKIPMERVDAQGLRAGKRGITTHASVTEAFKRSTHVDPGGSGDARWPWDTFLQLVRGESIA